ncbi:Holliday junction branch migration protein RuvA [Leptolyngbya sp. FACHB-261]|uniref:Holliday junction branch migration protein RuvA n=1 Tax=Leptolyngbya sp. FACHB-261 TaxID=2692806 RepID=UPI0016892864|nr:Holliday junction branch migration protein RuvA [Leptolyngbya sp. FACHB-261]MBD2103425.1 Holliday junction branch migration protein RuvA [Leptolyngbya sp. FACHB-261]
MIGYLKGSLSSAVANGNRATVTLDVHQVGYDLQVAPRLLRQLPGVGEVVQVFTHLQVREDQMVLYGFGTAAERDVFRQLISVSGVGAQLALALLDTLGLQDLIQAIVSENIRLLTRTPGVGTKTAQRLALELKAKLAEWRNAAGLTTAPSGAPADNIQADVEMTLLALGYTSTEVVQALQAVGRKTTLSKNANVEDWIREAIAWLAQ